MLDCFVHIQVLQFIVCTLYSKLLIYMKDPKNKNSPTVVWIICNLNELKICTCETNTYFIHCQVGFKRSGNEREKVIVAFGN